MRREQVRLCVRELFAVCACARAPARAAQHFPTHRLDAFSALSALSALRSDQILSTCGLGMEDETQLAALLYISVVHQLS